MNKRLLFLSVLRWIPHGIGMFFTILGVLLIVMGIHHDVIMRDQFNHVAPADSPELFMIDMFFFVKKWAAVCAGSVSVILGLILVMLADLIGILLVIEEILERFARPMRKSPAWRFSGIDIACRLTP